MKLFIKHIITIVILIHLSAGCGKNHPKPKCVNLADTLYLPIEQITFTSNHRKWEASLLSFIQTFPLEVSKTDTGINVSQKFSYGLLEGPAHICLKSGKNSYFYPFYLKNRRPIGPQMYDYRSPKSLIPDLNLSQQKILLATDEWRNILDVNSQQDLFFESDIEIPPSAGIYRAQKNVPLSSYYVRAGTCLSIPLEAVAYKRPGEYKITAGPLEDAHKNQIDDGTLMRFFYNDGKYMHFMETSIVNGFAFAVIPLKSDKTYQVFAKIDRISSDTITIKPTP